ncbi:O-antigen ligase family protein [Nonlabens ponticola]|uniref:O-antigen ligase-related domain-containing protein n=1 Tax=Nonlabens ponticola TaxID=2496866 RepID=A0A3S9MVB7_9FLAO|nr:O-antigen ligase family protein [Nonlabens ponticola]AZQ43121.1 hypothetical protein EJ995_02305 [Nonlabens ponticola]
MPQSSTLKIDRIENYLYTLLMVAFTMPLLPNFARNILLGLITATTLFLFFKQPERSIKDYRMMIAGSALYILYAVSLSYTENMEIGLRKMETGLSLLIIPIFSGLLPIAVIEKIKRNFSQFLWVYIVSVTLTLIIFWCIFIEHYGMSLFQHFPTVINKDLGPYNLHPIYLAMHGAVAILFSFYLLSKLKKKWAFAVLIFMSIIIACFMLIVIKKGPIISLVITALYLVFAYKNKSAIIALTSICGLFICVIIFQPKVNRKFSELLNISGQTSGEQMSSTNIRVAIFDCVNDIAPEAGLFGYGVGDAKDELLKCYNEKNPTLAKYKYNTHNQFMSIFLRVGAIGAITFIVLMLFILYRLRKREAHLAIAVVSFYLLIMFSENILERENGVLYFAFFTFVFYQVFKGKNKKSISITPIDVTAAISKSDAQFS